MSRFVYYNANPKQLHTNDCLVRALSYFLGVTWRKAFHDIVEWCADRCLVDWNYRSKYYIYLSEQGFSRHKVSDKTLTVGRFCDEVAKEGKVYMVQIKRHMTIVDNKEINDIWDCSDRQVDCYWER